MTYAEMWDELKQAVIDRREAVEGRNIGTYVVNFQVSELKWVIAKIKELEDK